LLVALTARPCMRLPRLALHLMPLFCPSPPLALLFIPDYRLADGLSNRMPHNQSQDFSTTSSHNSSDRSNSLSGWYFTGPGSAAHPHLSFSLPLSPFTSTNPICSIMTIVWVCVITRLGLQSLCEGLDRKVLFL